ncbi:MAG TPA: cytochrome c oxidase subunit 3 [Pseudolabrys sp.]|jgi:cytochrome c oxidase subunit 3|nr:cytochrome c oxidase subunit 3 [Pseudolabrys sp.]
MSEASTALREPWPDLARQREGVTFGIWIFLATEVLFFGGLFLGYSVYRTLYTEAFREAAKETEIFFGSINTVVLLTSSMTMTVAVRAADHGYRRLTLICLWVTLLLGLGFLTGKGFEYNDDLTKGLFPGPGFPLPQPQEQIFWAFYWVMTGVHAIHLSVGIGVVAVVAVQLQRTVIKLESGTLTAVGLYWHFVDLIWITLVPLIYLVDRP